ncbi:hypothetical protein BGZ82_003408 [Podila clonocystis]|nr:hypothetical protein BGZ82_003408 [Podila clonocystis]
MNATCRSLNRDWHAHFTPLFWKQLSTTKFATLKSLMTQPELREALSTNAHLIKHFKTTRLDVLEFFVHSPPSPPPRRPSDPSPATATPLSTNGKSDHHQVTELETPPTYEFDCGTTEALVQLAGVSLQFDQFRSGPIKMAGDSGTTTTNTASFGPTNFAMTADGIGGFISQGFGSCRGVLGIKDTPVLPQTPLFSFRDDPVSQR